MFLSPDMVTLLTIKINNMRVVEKQGRGERREKNYRKISHELLSSQIHKTLKQSKKLGPNTENN